MQLNFLLFDVMNIADVLSEPIQQRDTDEHKPASDLKPQHQLKQLLSDSKQAEIQELQEMEQVEGKSKVIDGGDNQKSPDEKKKSSDRPTATAESKDKELEHEAPKEKGGEQKIKKKTEVDYMNSQAQAGHATPVESMTKVDSSKKIASDTLEEKSHGKIKTEPEKQDQDPKSKKGEQTQEHSRGKGVKKQEVSSSKGKLF